MSVIKPNETAFFALGGLGEIGKNCYCYEHNDEIIMIDAGVKFPDADMLGVNYVIPDYTYIRKNIDRFVGLFITHSHEDHIGGIPFLLLQAEKPITIYATDLAEKMIANKLREHKIKNTNFVNFTETSVFKFKHFEISFFPVIHSIPDSFGILVKTPIGNFAHTGDFKFDFHNTKNYYTDFVKLSGMSRDNIVLLTSDSTGSNSKTMATSEVDIGKNLELVMNKIEGRIIASTFSSNMHRVSQLVDIFVKSGRKVLLFGTSLKKNFIVAKKTGYVNVKNSDIIEPEEISSYKDNEIGVICTGSQGEQLASLSRMSAGLFDKFKLKENDTVIFTSSPIVGNNWSVGQVINNLERRKVNVITNSPSKVIHASGHGGEIEQQLMLSLIQPKYFAPIHGEFRMLQRHAEIALDSGILDSDHIFMLNIGKVIAFKKQGNEVIGYEAGRVSAGTTLVQKGPRYVNNTTESFEDRKTLSNNGAVIASIIFNKNLVLRKDPFILSRGFVFMKDSPNVVKEIELEIKGRLTKSKPKANNIAELAEYIENELAEIIYRKTKLLPLVNALVHVE